MRRISVRDRGGIYDHSELFEWISTTVSSGKTSRIDQIFFLFPLLFLLAVRMFLWILAQSPRRIFASPK